jgi:hypothetical protein
MTDDLVVIPRYRFGAFFSNEPTIPKTQLTLGYIGEIVRRPFPGRNLSRRNAPDPPPTSLTIQHSDSEALARGPGVVEVQAGGKTDKFDTKAFHSDAFFSLSIGTATSDHPAIVTGRLKAPDKIIDLEQESAYWEFTPPADEG